ncbi:polysaccharide deacetylase family protein [Maledivibacter halophilus]|uniref:Probable sporulation protein, polysaccharide deacetylase family n=1 Tax=Maledivibacter halophilus TaxID=36842 RepID=A0A1T5LDI5_9FIRM|nr:polysaccharide deacetylase family protein [Maledivibacter halophilus]SKC74043.1 probable sporulation protein, polysaccharide deacetylase family [Maledivibacter halophilus]
MERTFKTFIIPVFFLIILIVSFFMCNDSVLSVFKKNELQAIRKGYNKDYIAFTCNVDWGTEYIPSMLEIFEKHDVKITFFVSGRWSKNNPQMLKKINDMGHEIGNHGYGHRMHSKIGLEGNREEIVKTHNIVKDIIKKDMLYFAPPAGDYNDTTLKAANEFGYKTILWNIDTIDWRKDSTRDKIIKRVLNKPLEGSIVLMHPKEETIKALDYLIKTIKERNIKVGRVSDVLKTLD